MSHAHRLEQHDEGSLLYLALDPDGEWARSEFPHPLITVDYDEVGHVIGISPVGPQVAPTLRAYEEWLRESDRDPHELVRRLNSAPIRGA